MLRGKKHLLSQERACELQHTGLASLHFQAGFNDLVLHQRLQQGSVALPKLTEREQDAAESRTGVSHKLPPGLLWELIGWLKLAIPIEATGA